MLMCYSWPGNMRELANVMESTFICCNTNQIENKDLPSRIITTATSVPVDEDINLTLKEQMCKAEKIILDKTLKMTGNNKAVAARLLGIHRTGLHKKIKKYGITTPPH